MIRRPMWFGTGVALGVAGTLWVEQRVRRRVRRAVERLSPAFAGSEAVRAVRGTGARVKDAVEVARTERHRHESELWRRIGEVPPGRRHDAGRARSPSAKARGSRRQHR
ncbi:MAG TPA: hypothetical protein VND62_06895 [Acidimicrobiales bacterium]|nr:hypothetical protein [Acidimicrobiales bacterium]